MSLEQRYKKSRGIFVPEYKDKQGNWVGFNYDNLDDTMKNLIRSLANYDRDSKTRNAKFSDSSEIYFCEEFLVKAFLAGAKEYLSTEINEFEVFDEEK